MFENLTYSKKNKLLIAAAIVAVYLIYVFAIKKTITQRNEYNNLQTKIELIKNAPSMAIQLQQQLLQMDAKIGNNTSNGQKTGQALLELLSDYCKNNKAVLRDFPASKNLQQGDLLVETNVFIVEGNYETLLKLVYLLEQKQKLGKVASVRYQYKKDIKTRNMALTATVYLQNIKKQNEVLTLAN